MNRLLALAWIVLAWLPCASAQTPAEEAAYLKLRRLRDAARTIGTDRSVLAFRTQANAFFSAYPASARGSDIHIWLGGLLERSSPREAFGQYVLSAVEAGRRRARDLAFRHEAPPPLAVERWIGPRIDPARVTGRVTLLFFFSETHPQTRRVLPPLLAIFGQYESRGLRMAGLAAVVDDYKSQRPARLAKRLRLRKLPFPVGIDRQRKQAQSISLGRYRGCCLPWAVLIDRYGRLAWLGGLDAQISTMAGLRSMLDQLLAQPDLAQLGRALKAGDEKALVELARIRTPATASAILAALEGSLEPALRARALDVLAELMPKGYLQADSAAALARWKRERGSYRYSFPRNRLVARR